MRELTQYTDGVAAIAAGGASLLDINPTEFAAHFNRRPFLIGHHLCEHPLFALPSLIELAKRLPTAAIEYNAGNIPLSLEPSCAVDGLSIDETVAASKSASHGWC